MALVVVAELPAVLPVPSMLPAFPAFHAIADEVVGITGTV